MTDDLSPKISNCNYCKICDYTTCKFSDFKKHIDTKKHIILTNTDKILTENTANDFFTNKAYKCDCGKIYKHRQSLFNHRKICKYNQTTNISSQNQHSLNYINPDTVMELIKDNKEMKKIILEQHETINNLLKNGTTQMTNSTNNSNNNNKTINLQFFLN
jgi:hypothetical protein